MRSIKLGSFMHKQNQLPDKEPLDSADGAAGHSGAWGQAVQPLEEAAEEPIGGRGGPICFLNNGAV